MRITQRLLDDWEYNTDVLPRSDFRENAAELSMQVNLRGHNVRQDYAPVLYDRRGSLVTGGFNAQDAGWW
jgi:hypothetical protein